MRLQFKFLALLGLVFCFGTHLNAATISGAVKGPDGKPMEGVFVQAQNIKTKMSFFVLSDVQGRYRAEKLPAGEYRVQVKATGFRGDPKSGVTLTADQTAAVDFSMQPGIVRWNELSIYQAKKLWPEDNAKQTIFTKCFICHGFQTRMASVTRDEDGWKDRVQFMRETMHFSLSYRITDQDAEEVATYLHKLYGEDSVLPKSAADAPGYKETLRPFTSEATQDCVCGIRHAGSEPHAVQRRPGKGRLSLDSEFWNWK